MPFTPEEAKQKVGTQVLVRGDSLAHEGIAHGTRATVIDAYTLCEDGWTVCVQFALSSDHWLLLPFTGPSCDIPSQRPSRSR